VPVSVVDAEVMVSHGGGCAPLLNTKASFKTVRGQAWWPYL
jgi:hypothetical protein